MYTSMKITFEKNGANQIVYTGNLECTVWIKAMLEDFSDLKIDNVLFSGCFCEVDILTDLNIQSFNSYQGFLNLGR